MEFVKMFILMFVIQFGRYLIIAGGAYWMFWGRANAFTERNRIQSADFRSEDLRREFRYSVLSSIIFAAVLAWSFAGDLLPNWQFRQLPEPTSLLQDAGMLVLLIVIHDTYFYWMHRMAHHPSLFRHLHVVHHQSKNPSPWASLSFQPTEAFLEIIWVVPVQRLLPIQPGVWMVFGVVILLINVLGHLGVEPYPKSWQNHPILKWMNFSTMHNDHHHYFNGNYGLYFSFWDRVMGTLRGGRELKEVKTMPINFTYMHK